MSRKTVGAKIVERLGRFAEQLEKVESLSDIQKSFTVRKVKLELRPREFSKEDVRILRTTQLAVSQVVFAEFIGVSPSTVRDWEQGRNEPNGPARRVMEEMCRDPETWKRRIRDLAVVGTSS